MNWFGQPHGGKKKFGKNEAPVGEQNVYSWDFHSKGVICGQLGHMVGKPHLKNWSLWGRICQGDSWPRKLYYLVGDCSLFFSLYLSAFCCFSSTLFPILRYTRQRERVHLWLTNSWAALISVRGWNGFTEVKGYLAFTCLPSLPSVSSHS